MRRFWTTAAVGIAGVALASGGQQTGGSIDAPAGARMVLEARGSGVQIYQCGAGSNGGFAWALQGPDAKLLDADGKTLGTHFAGPTWRLNDGSQVQGSVAASQQAAQPGAVAWLLLRAKAGSATGKLADVAYIRRA